MNEENENIVFHSEDKIMEILYQGNAQMESVNVSEGASFASQQLLPVVWDEQNNQQNWYVGLYLEKVKVKYIK